MLITNNMQEKEYIIVSPYMCLVDKVGYSVARIEQILQDAPRKKFADLERYFNDLHAIFLHKLSVLEQQEKISHAERKKLQSLVDELVQVKMLMDELSEG